MSTPEQASASYLDGLFGPGMGQRHQAYLRYLDHPFLRETMDRYHVLEADETHLSVTDNYLIGMAVLCALRSYDTAAMFAKVLLHLGEPAERIVEVTARLAMWIGGIPAAEAAAHMQRAIREYTRDGPASLAAWFPADPA